ncbi:M42 family metallopeptidase [Petroclostridium sp. X23]|uniref:M42 family metallopeptidase n=1 Tax=Petroclostridium sp. X23 TaxID=3045146 RepID=UPI0024AE271B|nr:M42 family metallopeptidase [Petroclostridium sp. X23]WHH59496.1 M42 family metallopeptidase [Petroclostridium sp. X23]
MMDLLKELTQCYGPSGNEEKIRELLIEKIKDYVDEISVDPLGNLIARKKGNGKKLMFAAHMDEIGIIVTFIDDNGFLRFSNIGGVSPHYSLFQKVIFENGTIGIIGYEEKIEEMKNLKLEKMFVDIGASSKEEAEKMVNIGDAACFTGEFHQNFNKVSSKAMDDRIGCYILIEVIKSIKDNHNDLYFVFTVQEELGLRGAKTSAYSISPDYAIAIDVTGMGDIPGAKPMALKLGKGPAVKVKDSLIITHPFVRNLMVDTAKENEIPYQLEVLERGGTDSGAIHLTKGGIPSGVLSIPTRYIHSPREILDMDDVKNAIALMIAIALKKIDK